MTSLQRKLNQRLGPKRQVGYLHQSWLGLQLPEQLQLSLETWSMHPSLRKSCWSMLATWRHFTKESTSPSRKKLTGRSWSIMFRKQPVWKTLVLKLRFGQPGKCFTQVFNSIFVQVENGFVSLNPFYDLPISIKKIDLCPKFPLLPLALGRQPLMLSWSRRKKVLRGKEREEKPRKKKSLHSDPVQAGCLAFELLVR